MVKRLVLLAFLAPGCSPAGSGDGAAVVAFVVRWKNQQRTPTSSHLRIVRFSSAATGWIAGESTSFFRTVDGGLTWTQQQHEPVSRGGDVNGMDIWGNFAHAAGADGSVGRWWGTDDGGARWLTPDVASTGFSPFAAVDVTSSTTGFALTFDGTIRKFVGSSITSFTVGAAGTYYSIAFPEDNSIGYVCGAGGALRKTANGLTFSALTSGVVTDLRKIHMVNSVQGYAAGASGVVLRTGDGTAWTPKSPATAATLFGVHFPASAVTGWVVGAGGVIFRTDSSGDSWTAQTSGVGVDLHDIWMVDNLTGYIVGDFGTVLKTVNGGATWTLLTGGVLTQLNAVDFSDDGQVGYAVGNGGLVLVTTNAGATWSASNPVAVDLHSVSVPTTGTVAYACGAGGTILKTINTGGSWSSQVVGAAAWRCILFPSSDTVGFVVGDGSAIRKTIDGATWNTQTSPVTTDYYAIAAPFTGQTSFACGTNGKVAKTENGGTLWEDKSPPAAAGVLLQSLQAPTALTVYAGGSNGTIYRSLNGGGFWDSVTPGATNRGLAFSDANKGWSVNGGIFYTENGGTAWAASFDHTNFALRGIWMSADGVTGCAVGDNGTVIRASTGGK